MLAVVLSLLRRFKVAIYCATLFTSRSLEWPLMSPPVFKLRVPPKAIREVVSDPCSVYDSPHCSAASPGFCPISGTPEFATPSPESCPLIDTPVFSSYDVSEVPTTPSQEPHTTIGYSRGQRLEELVSLSSATSSCVSRASSPATTISYEDDLSPVTLPLCVQWYVRGLASDGGMKRFRGMTSTASAQFAVEKAKGMMDV